LREYSAHVEIGGLASWAFWASFCYVAAVIGVTVAVGVAAAVVDIGRTRRGLSRPT